MAFFSEVMKFILWPRWGLLKFLFFVDGIFLFLALPVSVLFVEGPFVPCFLQLWHLGSDTTAAVCTSQVSMVCLMGN